MVFGENGVPVKRVQHALLELGFSIPDGDTGFFGNQTAAAVVDYKTQRGLVPNDPVVGAGTSKRLDDDLFVDPPHLDPAFAEFSPFVVDHRLEPFVARELAGLMSAGVAFDSWRRMAGQAALASLGSGELLGIVTQSRAIDLLPKFLAVADPFQAGMTAQDFFDNIIILGPETDAVTVPFDAGLRRCAFIIVKDSVILGRETLGGPGGTQAPLTLLGVLSHELTHVRNLARIQALSLTPDTDTNAFVDTALAQTSSASGNTTGDVLRRFAHEMVARHLHWIFLQEEAGTPGNIALSFLDPDRLASAAFFYFVDLAELFDPNHPNGYIAGISAQGDGRRYHQLERWLDLTADQSFSEDFAQDSLSTELFRAAARKFAERRAALPVITAFPEDGGIFPGRADFR
ncbi:peptidoglycan-binding domain-containing protein [Mycolicibacterium litorale]|uniref:peptidoglycan-binding domain-containing protein n=1 Tax=Mycolicibacterium litorale TaxID=758802 RepID=UPI003CF45482